MTPESKPQDKAPEAAPDVAPAGIADRDANAALEHTNGGTTTRDDANDVGVPMLQGSPKEPVGPEDAFGPGAKRGDYSDRVGSGPHVELERIPDDERGDAVQYVDRETGAPAKQGAEGAIASPLERPHTRVVDQSARASIVGDEPGKGGVTTEAALPREQAVR